MLAVLADGEFHSGEALGEQLGVSRAAVWKQLKKLEQLGVTLHSVKGRGYRLPDTLVLLDEERISAALDPSVRRQLTSIQRSLILESTNATAMAESLRGDRHGCLYLAEQQTAGRGRRGRPWISPFGRNLYFSLCWTFSGGAAALEGLSLLVGLAVSQGLADMGIEDVQLKWPNDLLRQRRKLAGILLEMSGDASGQCQVVIGVGINVAMSKETAAAIDQPWCDLSDRAVPVDRNQLLAAVLNRLLPGLQRFSREGFEPFRAAWMARDAFAGESVVLSTPRHQIEGRCLGVDRSGALLLQTEQGQQAFHGGEVSLRGAP
nr:bifunctional biotin--[acetyl-CoA-carboxylase] ligase/biotin operon repressor BirA [Motiliproteus sediminis]